MEIEAMAVDANVDVRVFAKPDARPSRRVAVAIARAAAARQSRGPPAAGLKVD